jgi:hypothetical protein
MSLQCVHRLFAIHASRTKFLRLLVTMKNIFMSLLFTLVSISVDALDGKATVAFYDTRPMYLAFNAPGKKPLLTLSKEGGAPDPIHF